MGPLYSLGHREAKENIGLKTELEIEAYSCGFQPTFLSSRQPALSHLEGRKCSPLSLLDGYFGKKGEDENPQSS